MDIWVDADACPVVIKEILFRAAERTGVTLTLVANHSMRIPPVPNIRFLQVESGFDVADNEIVRRSEPGDLVITGDIPLAAEVIEKGGLALSPLLARILRAALLPTNTLRNSGQPQARDAEGSEWHGEYGQ